MKQKAITANNRGDFERLLNEHFNDGWTLVPFALTCTGRSGVFDFAFVAVVERTETKTLPPQFGPGGSESN